MQKIADRVDFLNDVFYKIDNSEFIFFKSGRFAPAKQIFIDDLYKILNYVKSPNEEVYILQKQKAFSTAKLLDNYAKINDIPDNNNFDSVRLPKFLKDLKRVEKSGRLEQLGIAVKDVESLFVSFAKDIVDYNQTFNIMASSNLNELMALLNEDPIIPNNNGNENNENIGDISSAPFDINGKLKNNTAISDYNFKNNKQMITPINVSAAPFIMDNEIKLACEGFKPFNFNDEYLMLNNIVFKVYDEYADEFASGYLIGAKAGFINTLNKKSGLSLKRGTQFNKAIDIPCLAWVKENLLDIKLYKPDSNERDFNLCIFLNETSEILGDPNKYTLYVKSNSASISVIEFKMSDERQYYMFGEWLCYCLSLYKPGYKMPSYDNGTAVVTKNKAKAITPVGNEIFKRKTLIDMGFDEERLSYYEKAYGLTSIPIFSTTDNNNYKIYHLKYFYSKPEYYCINCLRDEKISYDVFDMQNPATFSENEILHYFPDKKFVKYKTANVAIDFRNRSYTEFVLFSYLYHNFLERKFLSAADFKGDELSVDEILHELNSLVGLSGVKKKVNELANRMIVEKMRSEMGFNTQKEGNHFIFTGNPGTGKTTVARCLGKLFHSMGMLPTEKVVEVSRADLVGQFVGSTAQKTTEVIKSAIGGILFIDEAYTLAPDGASGNDFGREAINTLLKEMEDNRDKFIVIAAGYDNEMRSFLNSNTGIPDRFPNKIHFDDYNGDELFQILEGMCKANNMFLDPNAIEPIQRHLARLYKKRDEKFANARTVRILLDNAINKFAVRVASQENNKNADTLSRLMLEDFGIQKESREVLDKSLNELKNMTGLSAVKKQISNIIALNQAQIEREKLGINTIEDKPSLHMVFTGNPGTGKTTVARLVAQIFKELGILSKGHLVEVDRSQLVAGYSGQTAIKTKDVVDCAKGGVLFIDEAYTLANENDSFGKEAIDTLLKEMEDKREDLVVIAAGYNKNMSEFINSNPGLISRFKNFINFEDYSVDDLIEIFKGLCKREQFILTDGAVSKLKTLFQNIDTSTFGNGRGVRNLYEKIKINQAMRLNELKRTNTNLNRDDWLTIEAEDIDVSLQL